MLGFFFDVEILYFSTFRKPNSTSLILTYIIPPFTTIRGMLANALGLKRDDYSLQDGLKIGISIKNRGFKNTEISKILKFKENKNRLPRNFPTSPMFREYLVNPVFTIYISGAESIIYQIFNALKYPKRSLYLGQSDNMIDLKISPIIKVNKIYSKEVFSVVDEIISCAIIEKIPYKFDELKGDYNIIYKILSIPFRYPINLQKEIELWNFEGKYIQMF